MSEQVWRNPLDLAMSFTRQDFTIRFQSYTTRSAASDVQVVLTAHRTPKESWRERWSRLKADAWWKSQRFVARVMHDHRPWCFILECSSDGRFTAGSNKQAVVSEAAEPGVQSADPQPYRAGIEPLMIGFFLFPEQKTIKSQDDC